MPTEASELGKESLWFLSQSQAFSRWSQPIRYWSRTLEVPHLSPTTPEVASRDNPDAGTFPKWLTAHDMNPEVQHGYSHTNIRYQIKSCGYPPRLKLSQNVFSYVLYHPYAQLGRLGHLRTAWKALNTFMQATELNPGSQRRPKWPRHWVRDSAYRLINLIVHTVGINATTVANRHPVSLC